jgi:mono/diheme cytochrome c family protein
MSNAELTAVISDGKGKMPAYGKRPKPDQVKDLLAYIRSMGKK